jgi:hypothetical protein
MATLWFKKDGSVEGACGQILDTEQEGVVIKRIHRRLKHRAGCLDALAQCRIQQWASRLLTPSNGFSLLFAPRAWQTAKPSIYKGNERGRQQYAMERIDCSEEINPASSQEAIMAELKLFYKKAISMGVWPCDYELYRQSDGRVALIDFDKFARWHETESGAEVIFPWGARMSDPLYPWSSAVVKE